MNINNRHRETVWIGLVKVETESPRKEFEGASRAYVNVVGLAKNRTAFRKEIKRHLADLSFKLIRLEKPEVLSKRIYTHKVDKLLHQLAEELFVDNQKIKFSTFHAYD